MKSKIVFETKESLFEKVVTPLSITIPAFLGFCIFIVEYLYGVANVNLVIVASSICGMASILIFSKFIEFVDQLSY